ncbi:cellulase family glycosylhydrolase [Actinopolymorpha rutila]
MLTWVSSRYRKTSKRGRVAVLLVPVIVSLIVGVVAAFAPKPGTAPGADDATAGGSAKIQTPLHTDGPNIVDASGKKVNLTGVNWFGFETETFVPHGLWARNWKSMLDQIRSTGFNTIRLPYSNQMFDKESKPTGINYKLNPDLKGLKGLPLMDKIVKGATDRGLMVLLDRHRPTAQAQSELWYTPQVSEKRWIDDWTMLAKHYKSDPRVIGADLHNEPRGQATWGTGVKSTDWRLAAERAGNAVLKANPNWLVAVEGVESYKNDYYWWGGNLAGAKQNPVRLAKNDKLVYAPHDYGPGVYQQKWFQAPNYPNNLPGVWEKHWAFLKDKTPLLLGEFGGKSVSPKTTEGKWQHATVAFAKKHGLNYTYWSWNANSGDTGGVLKNDWKTVDKAKLQMLRQYQAPLAEVPTADKR